MENGKCSCPPYLSNRGILHILQVVACIITVILGAFSGRALQLCWTNCMIIWSFCGILSLFIVITEMSLIERLIQPMCIDWDDFTTGIAFKGFITTCGSTICYAVFYHCPTCLWDWLVIIVAIILCAIYCLEFVVDKCDASRSVSYLARAPGLFKILEACVSCILFVLLGNYDREPIVIWCYVAFILPFLVIPVVIVLNVLKKMRNCLPFNLVRVELLFILISILLYIPTAILWPIFTLKDDPRPDDCPPDSCKWNISFMVAVMTCVNLAFFTFELMFTFLGTCGFQRDE